jgi:hypothetical protein
MAIEYYDYDNKDQLYKLFLNKLNDLMSKNTIIEYLDKVCEKGGNTNIMDYDNEKLNNEIFPNFNEKKGRNKSLNHKDQKRLSSGQIDFNVDIFPQKKKIINIETKKTMMN